MVYGSCKGEMNAVRTFKAGALKFRNNEGETMKCDVNSSPTSAGKFCFLPQFQTEDEKVELYAGKSVLFHEYKIYFFYL